MDYLLYLMFRCDRRCDGCDGKFGNFVGTKHTLIEGTILARNESEESLSMINEPTGQELDHKTTGC